MKGIRKLFLGLILLTLFGVAFKVEAKAAPNPSIELGVYNSTHQSVKWYEDDALLRAYIAFSTDRDFPHLATASGAGSVSYVYDYTLTKGSPAVTIDNGTITFTTEYNDAARDYKIDGNSFTVNSKDIVTRTKTNVMGDINDGTTGLKTLGYTFTVTYNGPQTTGTGTATYDNAPATGYTLTKQFTEKGMKVTPEKKYNGSTTGAPSVTFSPTNVFLLKDDRYEFTISKESAGFVLSSWSGDSYSRQTDGTVKAVFTMGDTSEQPYANYTDNPAVTLTFNKELTGAVTSAGNYIDTRTFTFTGGYTGDDIDTITLRQGSTDLPCTDIEKGSGATGQIRFKMPASATSSTVAKTLTITMDDGRKFTRDVYVINPADVVVSVTPSTKTLNVDESQAFTPSLTPAISGAVIEYEYTSTGSDNYVTKSVNTSTGVLTLTGKDVTPAATPVKFKAKATFNIEGNTGAQKESSEVNVTVTNPTLTLSTVYVNAGLAAPLTDFINLKGASTITSVTLSSDASSSVSLNKNSGAANTITITGNSSASGKKITNGITVVAGGVTKTADVVVYPKPTITQEKDSSSSSSTSNAYKYSITVPKAVYYGSATITDTNKKARLKFEANDQTFYVDLESLDSKDDYTYKKDSFAVSKGKFRDIFSKICKKDEQEVKVSVVIDGAEDVASETKTLKVYKVNLDTSGGATYSVDGLDNVYSFYGIDGLTYKIDAKGSSAKASINEKESSSEFANQKATNGTVSINYGVAGARTLKASFKTSSTPDDSGSGGGESDDYDDVPKTGESKADIWILWSVLFISILGAGFMIWKRFGLVRAIAEADEEVAAAEFEEKVNAAKKEKEDKMKMLKDLRNL